MKPGMVLLAPVALLLLSLHHIEARHLDENLKRILDLTDSCIAFHAADIFVVDLLGLAGGNCDEKFFCKLPNFLRTHDNICQTRDQKVLMRHLEIYNKKHMQCEEVLKHLGSSPDMVLLSKVFQDIKDCVRQRNFFSLN